MRVGDERPRALQSVDMYLRPQHYSTRVASKCIFIGCRTLASVAQLVRVLSYRPKGVGLSAGQGTYRARLQVQFLVAVCMRRQLIDVSLASMFISFSPPLSPFLSL